MIQITIPTTGARIAFAQSHAITAGVLPGWKASDMPPMMNAEIGSPMFTGMPLVARVVIVSITMKTMATIWTVLDLARTCAWSSVSTTRPASWMRSRMRRGRATKQIVSISHCTSIASRVVRGH